MTKELRWKLCLGGKREGKFDVRKGRSAEVFAEELF